MAEQPAAAEQLEVHFSKSNLFRVVMAEGCFGGVSPRGMIHCSFYNERVAIPQRSVIPVTAGQPSGAEQIVETKQGVVREVEVDVMMDINTAVALQVWLADKIDGLRKALGISDEDFKKMVSGGKL